MSRSRRFLVRASLVVAVMAAAVVVAELIVRRVYPVRTPIFRLDERLIHVPIPAARRVLVMDGAASREDQPVSRVPIAFDERGFRRPFTREQSPRRPDRPLLAVYGDSLVLAENVRFEETFVEQLRGVLLERGRDVDTVNAGVTGYGPDQALFKLEDEVEWLEPDIVVLVVCAHNDAGDVLRNKIARLGDDGSLVRSMPSLSEELRRDWARAAREGRRLALRRVWDLRLEKRALRRQRASAPHPYMSWYSEAIRAEHADYESGDARVFSAFNDYYDLDLAVAPGSASARTKRALLEAIARRLVRLCAERELQLHVLIVPSAVDLDPGFEIRVDPLSFPEYDPRRLSGTHAEAFRAGGAAVTDLAAGWGAPATPAELFVGGSDFHWTARGQALAAALVASALRE